MRFIVIALISLILNAPAHAISEKFTIQKDLTYDGVPEHVVYEVSGKNWDQPISWSFTVYNGEHVAYRHVVTNDDNIVHFEDPGYVGNCNELVDCRKEWFLNRAFPSMFATIEASETQRHGDILQMYKIQAPQFYMKQLGLNKYETSESINRLANFLKERDIVGFSMPTAPVDFGTLMTFDKFHNKFVHLYHP